MCENAHTSPSLKRGGKRKKDQDKGGGNKLEQKKGPKGGSLPITERKRLRSLGMSSSGRSWEHCVIGKGRQSMSDHDGAGNMGAAGTLIGAR